jgi:hypothetical protein
LVSSLDWQTRVEANLLIGKESFVSLTYFGSAREKSIKQLLSVVFGKCYIDLFEIHCFLYWIQNDLRNFGRIHQFDFLLAIRTKNHGYIDRPNYVLNVDVHFFSVMIETCFIGCYT